mmetsp:Transcript_1998/g.2497  ORF Transcript_1998/g.2497 Transcript_1998/m.2497 type:complete len:207 (+) Transcript_1998:145-765(+)
MTPNISVNANDVLCGRGGATNNHAGNKRFRKQVACQQAAYLVAKKRDKKLIAKSIVDAIRKEGGRFLKREEKDGVECWVDVGDKKASEKTSQALREGLDVRATKKTGVTKKIVGKKRKSDTSPLKDLLPESKNQKQNDESRSLPSETAGTTTESASSTNKPPLQFIPPTLMNELGIPMSLPNSKKDNPDGPGVLVEPVKSANIVPV